MIVTVALYLSADSAHAQYGPGTCRSTVRTTAHAEGLSQKILSRGAENLARRAWVSMEAT